MEQEKYFSAVVNTTPMGNQRCLPVSTSDSLTSLDSLLLAAGAVDPLSLSLGDTPDPSRRNPLARAVNSLRSSGGKAKCKLLFLTLLSATSPSQLHNIIYNEMWSYSHFILRVEYQ